MAVQTTIVFITDNKLDVRIAELCKRYLLKAADGRRIISVSQEPIDLGENICIGDIGRNGLSIDLQIKAGLEKVESEFVAIAEHDCIYDKEHFNFKPPDNEYFYYNTNCWLLQHHSSNHPEYNGMFSFVPERCVQSQLITGRDALMEATERKITILSDPDVQVAWPVRTRLGEPGTDTIDHSRRVWKSKKLYSKWRKVKEYITSCNAKKFETSVPNLDIRHGGNLTGGRRGTNRCWSLEPYGTMKELMG